MSSPLGRERPLSVATTATLQSEAPPPYSEYDESYVPPPNEQTQAMLRGGYLVRHQRQEAPSVREYGPATAYMRGRPYSGQREGNLTIARAIHPGIKADGVPFPSEYPAVGNRDVSREDWSYFVDCVLGELEPPDVKGAIATPVSLNEFRERQDNIDATIDHWNRGFFGPRGIHIVPAYSFHGTSRLAETIRSSSPTPTYRTERTVSQDDEIMTITIDTSPRSTRAGTPETIREFNQGGDTTPPGALTPKTVDDNLKPPTEPGRPRKNSIPRKPVLPKRPSTATLGSASDHAPASGEYGKGRRKSMSSDSEESDSSLETLSSDDELAYGDVPQIRRTLAREFERDPRNWVHLKAALKQIREDVRQQQKDALGAGKHQRGELKVAAKEHRKQMRGEMKELRKEMRGYYKEHRNAKKGRNKQLKEMSKELKADQKGQRKENKKLRKQVRGAERSERRNAGNRSPEVEFRGRGARRWGDHHHHHHGPPMGPFNMSMPQLGGLGGAGEMGNGPFGMQVPGQGMPPRAMSSISFDGTGASPSCVRSRSPRPGTAESASYDMPNVPGVAGMHGSRGFPGAGPPGPGFPGGGHPGGAWSAGSGFSGGGFPGGGFHGGGGFQGGGFPGGAFAGGALQRIAAARRHGGPVGMARDFLMAQANAGIERLRIGNQSEGPAQRAAGDEKRWGGPSNEGQETGVLKR